MMFFKLMLKYVFPAVGCYSVLDIIAENKLEPALFYIILLFQFVYLRLKKQGILSGHNNLIISKFTAAVR